MATQQLQLVCDQSTYANFYQWASAISAWFAACGWLQATDTGQVMWSGLTISAVSMSGSNATYTYSGLTGLALAVGRTVTITGMSAANNGTFRITSLGAGTFTVVNAGGSTETHAGAVTAASAVPGSGAFVYEIWQPGDGLQNFYVKVEYGNVSGTNCPSLRITLSTTTNGAGAVSGYSTLALGTNATAFTPPSTTTQYECNFSGDSGRMGVMLWRNGTGSCQQFFAIERGLTSGGTPASPSLYATLWVAGYTGASNTNVGIQQSLYFSAGAAPGLGLNATSRNAGPGGFLARLFWNQQNSSSYSSAFNGSIPFDACAPMVGFIDYPSTVVGVAAQMDITEGVTFAVTVYGATRTYMPSKVSPFCFVTNNQNAGAALCMRYD